MKTLTFIIVYIALLSVLIIIPVHYLFGLGNLFKQDWPQFIFIFIVYNVLLDKIHELTKHITDHEI